MTLDKALQTVIFTSIFRNATFSYKSMYNFTIFRKKGHRRIAGYDGLCVRRTGSTHEHNKTKVFLMESAKRAVLFAQDISLWDLDAGYVVARFKPDIPVRYCDFDYYRIHHSSDLIDT